MSVPHLDTDAIDWVEEARRGVVCDIGQLSDDARRRLKNATRGPRAEIETWRGYWAPVSGASYGMGPLKTCYGPFGAKDALP